MNLLLLIDNKYIVSLKQACISKIKYQVIFELNYLAPIYMEKVSGNKAMLEMMSNDIMDYGPCCIQIKELKDYFEFYS